ncbi:hypothetical protein VTN96DRAFT_10273 [Rasamsonia emersonii]
MACRHIGSCTDGNLILHAVPDDVQMLGSPILNHERTFLNIYGEYPYAGRD